jgi:hypothetical protein
MTLILSGTDGLSDVDGSAATPAIRGTDANTGIFFPAADTIAFSEGGVEAARFDSAGNLGIGVTPSAWRSSAKVLQLGGAGVVRGESAVASLSCNNYINTSNQDIYINTGVATSYAQFSGQHVWFNAPSGTAGNAITFTQAMTLDASGNLGVGTTSPALTLDVERTTTTVFSGTGYRVARFHCPTAVNADRPGIILGYDSAGAGIIAADTQATGQPIAFWTYNGSAWAERARIDSSGNLLVGTTSTYNSAKFSVAGDSEQRGNIKSYQAGRGGLANGGTVTLWSVGNGSFGFEVSMILYVSQRDDTGGNLTNVTYQITGFGGAGVDIQVLGGASYGAGRPFTVTASSGSGGIIITFTNTSGGTSTSVNMLANVLYGYNGVTWGF